MVDEYRFAVLRGFDVAVADIGDELHLCHPLLSFEGAPTLYVARRLDWQNDRKALAVADPSEASDLGTLLSDTHEQAIASGEAVIAAGTGFVQAAKAAGVQLDGSETTFARVRDTECRISVATQANFAKLKIRLADEARTTFDEELGDAARRGRHLSERGNAALLIMRRCGPRRQDDLAIRQLAGALQNRELDLYRRLLIRFALELGTQENDLDRKAERHIALASTLLPYTTLDLSPGQKYGDLSKLPVGDIMASLIYANSKSFRGIRRLERDFEKFLTRRGRSQTPVVKLGAWASHPQARTESPTPEAATWQSGRTLTLPRIQSKAGWRTILYRCFAEAFMDKGLYDRTCLPSHKVPTSKLPLYIMNWKEDIGQHLPVSGGIMPERHIYKPTSADFSLLMGESKPPVTVYVHSRDFGEGIQRDPEDVHLMFAQSKKLPSGVFSFISKPRDRISAGGASRKRSRQGRRSAVSIS